MKSGGRGQLAEERWRPDERGAAVPGGDGTLRDAAIGAGHQVSLIVRPGHADRQSLGFHRVPDASVGALLGQHDPLALLLGGELRVVRVYQLLNGAVDHRRIVHQAGHHPRRATRRHARQRTAASVPSAAVDSGRNRRPASPLLWPGSVMKYGSDLVICAVNSSNSCNGSRVDTKPATRTSAGRYSAAPPDPASASHEPIPVRGPLKAKVTSFSTAPRRALFEEQVLHPDHACKRNRRGIVFDRGRDQRRRVDRDQPADAALVPLADSGGERKPRALTHLTEGPRR